MPSVNLRLTGSEHELLLERARLAKRSLQKQIIFELFERQPAAADEVLSERGDEREGGPRVAVDPSPRSESTQDAAAARPRFHPDFKHGRPRK